MALNLIENIKETGGPWWVQLVIKFGIPTAFAAYLIYVLTTQVTGTLTSVKENLILHSADVQYNVKQNEKIYYLLRVICSNASADETDRNKCFE
jgi:hypothetical protein